MENADSQEYLNPNIVRRETASFLEAGYYESGTNLAQFGTLHSILFSQRHMLANQLFQAAATTGYLGKLTQPHHLSTHYVNNKINKSLKVALT